MTPHYMNKNNAYFVLTALIAATSLVVPVAHANNSGASAAPAMPAISASNSVAVPVAVPAMPVVSSSNSVTQAASVSTPVAPIVSASNSVTASAPVVVPAISSSNSVSTGGVNNGGSYIPSVSSSNSISNSGSSNSIPAVPVVSGSNSLPGNTLPVVPTVSGSNSLTSPAVPTVSGSNSISGNNGTTTSTSTDSTTSSGSTGGSSSSGGGFSSAGGSGFIGSNGFTLPNCGLALNGFMSLGANNNPAEVKVLQTFLNTNDGAHLAVSGIFDSATEAAVEAFQTKYASAILSPWGASQPTGRVYITTLKQINQLMCHSQIALTPAELAIINAYRNSVSTSNSQSSAQDTTQNPTIGTNTTVPYSPNEVGAANNPVAPEVAVANPQNGSLLANALSGVGSFFGNLFGAIGHFLSR